MTNPPVSPNVLTKEPTLVGLGGLDIFKIVAGNLTANGVMVILDNHMSDSDWCCNENDNNGLW
jgi:endoglucanase